MAPSELRGNVQTVLGPVSPDSLGPTLTHEHLLIDFVCSLLEPEDPRGRAKARQPISMENLGWIRYNWLSNLDNLVIDNQDEAIAEAMHYKQAGGGTIVDVTTVGIGRDPVALVRIARATGLNIVMGAGFYVGPVHPQNMADRSDADVASQLVKEITEGVDETGVRAGIIGEIGCSWPLLGTERKVLRAAAMAQRETGAAILIHPGRDEQAPREIIGVLGEAGADIGRTIMGHIDRTISNLDTLKELAETGCYMEYDLFGLESSYYPHETIDMPSDAQRINFILWLIAQGYGDRIVVSHDICVKTRLVKYGGQGFAHIMENIVPRMRRKGIVEDDIQGILVENPRRLLTFV